MNTKVFLVILLAFLSVSPAHARADVSLRNGNFFVTLRDISYPGGLEPRIERVYNSKSDYTGIFGYSWGTKYEVNLVPDSDGSLVLTEFGGGASVRFIPKSGSSGAGVSEIVEAAKKAGMVSGGKSIEDFKQRLTDDYAFRAKNYGIMINKGLLPRKVVAEGTQFTSLQFQYQYITKVKGGYTRVMEEGMVQKFNEAGKLVQIMDRNKNYINFSYDKAGHLVQLIDNQNRKMNLSYNVHGHVESITGESGKRADYKYNKEGFLVYSRDDAGVENTFKYTTDEFRNITEIGFTGQKNDKGQPKRMVIAYYGRDKKSSVKSVQNPDGSVNEYEYLTDLNSPSFYAVRVVAKDSAGAKISDSKYEYYSKVKPGGDDLVTKMLTTVDGDVTETIYDERLGFPIKITSNGRVTTMDYDAKGRMVKKVTPFETTELTYDPKVGKASKVVKKLKSGSVRWSQFQWDPVTGNLLTAKNSEKKTVKLVYDSQGRIRALVDDAKHSITFKYNELSKPIEIADAKLGVVKFKYKNSGEVDKIESNGGASVSAEIMRALQTLIDITAPAGVTMGI
ncbi:MAG: hypothetical protein KGP28_12850 [Bdellovibrionales bacterium]|nr:hypothetical protein [Bdellovibrionales bacterium]